MSGKDGEVGVSETERVVYDLNVAKFLLGDPQMLTPEMCVRIGQAITSAITLLTEQNNCENCAIAIEDRQPVVRCRDCIHWDKEHTEECGNLDSVCFHNGWCKPDWFCAYGERKEDRYGVIINKKQSAVYDEINSGIICDMEPREKFCE